MLEKKMIVVVILILGLFLIGNVEYAQADNNMGIGLQFSSPSFGFSGIMDLNEEISVQGVLGLFGNINMYSARGLYRFNQEEHWNVYGFGSTGIVSDGTDSSLGLGGGGGLEYSLQAWNTDLPPLYYNIELGLSYIDLDYSGGISMSIGSGLHYKF